jgi:hypothetical protein
VPGAVNVFLFRGVAVYAAFVTFGKHQSATDAVATKGNRLLALKHKDAVWFSCFS